MMGKICGFHGCEEPAKVRYCCDAHAHADRQARYRRRVTVEMSLVVDNGPYERIRRSPRAFGVETTADVAYCFMDDQDRWCHQGIRSFRIDVA